MSELTRAHAEELFERRRRAWLEEDSKAYLQLWAEDMVIELPGRADPIRGRGAYAALIEQSFARLRPVSWDFHRLAIDGDHVLSEWTISGEDRATGRSIAWRGMAICRIAGGQIQEWREYWDPSVLRAAAPA